MANIHRPIRLRRCAYTNRGCTATVREDALWFHHEECGFAPIQCTHEGCQVTVNRQNVINHQQNCEFRSVSCEECDETMKQRDYEKHYCVLQRIFQEFEAGLSPANQPHAKRGQPGNNLVRPTKPVPTRQAQRGAGILQFETTQIEQVVTRRFASQVVGQPNSRPRPLPRRRVNSLELAAPSTSDADDFRAACSISSRSQRQPPVEGEIVIAGGIFGRKSYEIFNWSTQQWTLYEDELFFDHTDGFSFLYNNKVLFCGGTRTSRVESVDIANNGSVLALGIQLPGVNCGKGVLCGDKILTFGESVSETLVRNPFGSSVRVRYNDERKFSNYGIACVNDNAVVVVGGNNFYTRVKYSEHHGEYNVSEKKEYTDDVALYNPLYKSMTKLAPLPYGLCDMAVVAHGDNIIILGGRKGHIDETCNDVLMYNITEQYCSKLPSMLEKRSRCAAVLIGDTIVVFGGMSRNKRNFCVEVETAEYFILGENSWKKLPPMHYTRAGAIACVLA